MSQNNQKSTELIYTGKCKEIIDGFKQSNLVYVNRKNITIKKGTPEFSSFYDEWRYYPVTFNCTDNLEPPKCTYLAGDFMHSTGCIKQKY
jgi:hypothetical protein